MAAMTYIEALSTGKTYIEKANGTLDAQKQKLLAAGSGFSADAARESTGALRMFQEAERYFGIAAVLDPTQSEVFKNLGYVATELGRAPEAVVHYQRALEIDPASRELRSKLANAYFNTRRLDEALSQLRQLNATRGIPETGLLSPESERAIQQNMGRIMICRGEMKEGWRIFDSSRKVPDLMVRYAGKKPFAEGSAGFCNRRVVVVGEQGVGDEVMYASCLQEVVDCATTCTIICNPRLKKLFARSFPRAVILADNEASVIQACDEAEVVTATGSLPRYLRLSSSSFPRRGRYLLPDTQRTGLIRAALKDQFGSRPLVGVAWRGGNIAERNGRERSFNPGQMHPLFRCKEVAFVNLQHFFSQSDSELQELTDAGVQITKPAQFDPEGDLDEYSAALAALDLIISVDNANVHFAGALGAEVWTLLPFMPDTRWGILGSTCPWYSTMTLIRQPRPGDWESVIAVTSQWLADRASEGHAHT